jgi:hypothetical protein
MKYVRSLLFIRCVNPQDSVIFVSPLESRLQEVVPVNTAQRTMSHPQPMPLRSRGRLTFNEQLCFFGSGTEVTPTEASFGWWATLALLLAVVPWALVGLTIWMFA